MAITMCFISVLDVVDGIFMAGVSEGDSKKWRRKSLGITRNKRAFFNVWSACLYTNARV